MNNKKVWLLYTLCMLVVSIPVLNDFLIRGHDIYFHLMRIEGLTQGLRDGQFPVRIQPLWYHDYGYAVSVFYGDIFLYIAAFLRMLGFSLQNAYKGYLLCANLAAIAIAGYSFKGIFKSAYIGAFGSVLYTLATYRLSNLYTRGALGEYTGIIFLPLLAYACVLLLDKERNKQKLKKGAYLLGIGMACILQCHILTAELSCIALGIVMLCFLPRVLHKEVIAAGIKAVGIAVGLSTWFLVPFLDYMLSGKFNINHIQTDDIMIQRQGVVLSQVFALFDHAVGESLDISAGTRGDFAQGTGLALALAIPCFVVCFVIGYRRKKQQSGSQGVEKLMITAAMISTAAVGMSSAYFPWDTLCRLSTAVKFFIVKIQFPWRFTGIANLGLVVLWCSIIAMLWRLHGKRAALGLSFVVMLLSVVSAGYFISDLFQRAQRIEVQTILDMDTEVASGDEYLIEGTALEALEEMDYRGEEGLEVSDYQKQGTTIQLHVKNTTSITKAIELPLLYYDGYQATIEASNQAKEKLQVSSGTNHVVRVEIKAEAEGDIEISFRGKWYWRAAELLSLLIMLWLMWCLKFGGSKATGKAQMKECM